MAASLEHAAVGARTVERDFTPVFEVAAILGASAWVAERLTAIETMMENGPALYTRSREQSLAAGRDLWRSKLPAPSFDWPI